MRRTSERIFAFTHIPKTAGMTINRILYRHFGWRHLTVEFRKPPIIYTLRDLRQDLKLNPFTTSIAGHALKPFVDFGEYEGRLWWYTFLRDPIKRFISHYQHQINGGLTKHNLPFRKWMKVHDRRNWMVRMIAGEEDLEAAKQILNARFRFVGLVERFDESLLLLRSHLELGTMQIDYPAPANRAPSNKVRDQIYENLDDYRAEIAKQNNLDIELYNYVVREIWPPQVAKYGAEALPLDVRREIQHRAPGFAAECRRASYLAHRFMIYKPFLHITERLRAT